MPRYPVNNPYTITTRFGVPDSNALFGKHSGLDFAVPLNRPIYAPASGTLTNVVSPTGGNMVKIFDGKYYIRLMHNNSFSRANGPVTEGVEVAKAGTTGLSTGVHSHFDVAVKNTPTSFADFINPDDYINEGGEMQEQINELNKQLSKTNQYVEQNQIAIAELNKQLGLTNGYVDKLTTRVAKLEQGSGTTPDDGLYELKKVG